MSKTLLSIMIIAGVVIVFVLGRYTGLDTDQFSTSPNEGVQEAPSESEFDAWVVFQPDDNSFSVSFPRKPAHISEKAHDAFGLSPKNYNIYAADGLDKKGYMLEVITFPEGPNPATDTQILENTLKDIISHSTLNTLEESKEETFKGNKALSFKIDSGERKLQGVIFVLNETLFVLTRVSPDDYAGESQDYKFFIQSFKPKKNSNNKDPL
ncbi:MAG: hypothetical protein AAGG81_03910 [Chlamydiota bacterium]